MSKNKLYNNVPVKEKVLLVGVILPFMDTWNVEDSLGELAFLSDTADLEVVGCITQNRKKIDATYFIGKGKASEIKEEAEILDADTIVFDDDLSPAQLRNLEKLIDLKVIDRSELILSIFAMHARTAQAKIQVELAQLEYTYPRLRKMWSHLGRLGGGIGTRGPGETQLEVDRRRIQKRISDLKKKLKEIAKQYNTQKRGRDNFYKISLVGYTNAGKSTLFNALTKSNIFVEDRLFATLDTTVRRLELTHNKALISDTVGFIRKLPAHLMASFHTTLEEVIDSDLLVHIVDITHPYFRHQIEVVEETLGQLGIANKPTLLVFNKCDICNEPELLDILEKNYPESISISALKGDGLDLLKEKLGILLEEDIKTLDLELHSGNGKLISYVYSNGEVLNRTYKDGTIYLQVCIRNRYIVELKRLLEESENMLVA